MALSKIWYHASVVEFPDKIAKEIEKICLNFLWCGKGHKISKQQLRWSKEEAGLNFWNLSAKVAASKSNWIAAHINNKLNKSFSLAIKAWEEQYKQEMNTDIPLWASRTYKERQKHPK